MCTLAAACSQIPWDADPTVDNERTFPVAAPAVFAPAAQPASTAGVAPATTAPVAAHAAAPAQAPAATPAAVVPVPPVAKPQEAKEIEPPHAIDLARPADDLWDRIRSGAGEVDRVRRLDLL